MRTERINPGTVVLVGGIIYSIASSFLIDFVSLYNHAMLSVTMQ